uniref:AT-rich interactive domain-containing protein 2-like n=1 Tax=Phallusia mammillata TaxID=59560 RepID=A0A6F9D6J5_9ASCI|nr:AT-rich interactive domain-containing protein 2-like [Phallusia mammillata]
MNKNNLDDGEKLAFLNGLQQFLEDKGKVLLPYPRLAGKIIDLHDLYNRVTSLGGYQKVTEKELWDEFLLEYKFPVISSTLAFGLRTIYQRFLEEYERVHYFGDDEVPKKPRFDASIKRSRNPLYINERDRAQFGLSATRLSEPRFATDISDYERIAFSLTSGLPNEVDFAINACTLLSGESRHVLRLSRCPQLLEALLLHAGISSSNVNSYEQIGHTWKNRTGHNFSQFWNETVCNQNVLMEMLPECSSCVETDPQKTKTVCDCCNQDVSNKNSHHAGCKKLFPTNCHSWSSVFQSKRCLGVQDYEGQRILQIALVLLNLSFENFNVPLLANNKSLVRFVFLCIHSNYSSLRQTGLDILGNVSASMNIENLGLKMMKCTYVTVERCIKSRDKFDKIRGFEVLGNLCKSIPNKDTLLTSISDEIFKSSVLLLTIGDIELAIAAIEALYTLSKLGEETCTRITFIPGSIEILVCLITFNVRTLGSSQLSAIRIARRISPPTVAQPQQQIHRPVPPAALPNYPVPRVIHPHHVKPTHHIGPHYQAVRPHQPSPLVHTALSSQSPVQQFPVPVNPVSTKPINPTKQANRPVGAGPTYTHSETTTVPPVFHYMPAPPSDIVLDKSPESFAQLWVWATYEQCGNDDGSVPRVQLFADYATAASRYGMCSKNQVLPAAEFGRCLQRVFSNTASRLFNDCNAQPMYHITGIRKRQTPLPVPGYHPQVPLNIPNSKHSTSTASHTSQTVVTCQSNSSSLNHQSPITSLSVSNSKMPNLVSDSKSKASNNSEGIKYPLAEIGSAGTSPTKTSEAERTNGDSLHFVANGLQTKDHKLSGEHSEEKNLPDSSLQKSNVISSNCLLEKQQVNGGVDDLHESVSQSAALTSKDDESTDAHRGHCESLGGKADRKSQIHCKIPREPVNHIDTTPFANHINSNHKPAKTEELKTEGLCNGFPEDKESSKSVLSSDDTSTDNNKPATHGINGSWSPTEMHQNNSVLEVKNNPKPSRVDECKVLPKTCEPNNISTNENQIKAVNTTSPQTSPSGPNQLKQYHKVQKNSSTEEVSTQLVNNTSTTPVIGLSSKPEIHEPKNTLATNLNVTKQSLTSQPIGSNNVTHIHTIPKTSECGLKRGHEVGDEAPDPKQLRSKIESTALLPKNNLIEPVDKQTNSNPTPTAIIIPNSNSNHFPQTKPTPGPPVPPSSVPPGQRKPPPIDLMAPNASLMVLFRNSGKQPFEDFSDDKEDPISKSIRLTAALILMNIAKFCDHGRSLLQRHESWLAQLAMSGMDCSPNLAKLLAEMDR